MGRAAPACLVILKVRDLKNRGRRRKSKSLRPQPSSRGCAGVAGRALPLRLEHGAEAAAESSRGVGCGMRGRMGWHCPVPVGCLAVAPENCSAGRRVASPPFPLLAARGSPRGEARGPWRRLRSRRDPRQVPGAGLARLPEGCPACGRTCGTSGEQRGGEEEGAAMSVPLPPCRGICVGGGGTTVRACMCPGPQTGVAMGQPEPSAPTSRCLPCLRTGAGAGAAGREGHSPSVSGFQLRRFAGAGDREQTG